MNPDSMVAALFVQENGCYSNLPGVDMWTEGRDARRYDGPWPVAGGGPPALPTLGQDVVWATAHREADWNPKIKRR